MRGPSLSLDSDVYFIIASSDLRFEHLATNTGDDLGSFNHEFNCDKFIASMHVLAPKILGVAHKGNLRAIGPPPNGFNNWLNPTWLPWQTWPVQQTQSLLAQ